MRGALLKSAASGLSAVRVPKVNVRHHAVIARRIANGANARHAMNPECHGVKAGLRLVKPVHLAAKDALKASRALKANRRVRAMIAKVANLSKARSHIRTGSRLKAR